MLQAELSCGLKLLPSLLVEVPSCLLDYSFLDGSEDRGHVKRLEFGSYNLLDSVLLLSLRAAF